MEFSRLLRRREWMDLALVDDYTRFLLDPQSFLDGAD
jgi:hypothetical protein